jgi:hypothetical protein
MSPREFFIISAWDWGHVPFLAFLRIPSSLGVLSERRHMRFVGNAKHHPLRRQLTREMRTLRNASIFIPGNIHDWKTIYRRSRFMLVPR